MPLATMGYLKNDRPMSKGSRSRSFKEYHPETVGGRLHLGISSMASSPRLHHTANALPGRAVVQLEKATNVYDGETKH